MPPRTANWPGVLGDLDALVAHAGEQIDGLLEVQGRAHLEHERRERLGRPARRQQAQQAAAEATTIAGRFSCSA